MTLDSWLFPFSYHLYSPTSRSDCPCSLAQLLGYFSHYWGFTVLFDYQPLTLLFPMKKGQQKAGVEQNDSAGHGDDNGDRRRNWPGLYFDKSLLLAYWLIQLL